MNCLGDILTGIGGFLLLGDIWTSVAKWKLHTLYLHVFVTIPTVAVSALLLAGEVDRFAGLWGHHAWWKLIFAALIFALFWPISLGVFRYIQSKRERRLGYAWSFFVFVALLAFVLVDWIKFPASMDLPPEAYQTFPWLSIHPSLAIHHLYANATYLGAWELIGASLLVGKPVARELAHILGSQRRAVLLNVILFVTGVVLRTVKA